MRRGREREERQKIGGGVGGKAHFKEEGTAGDG